MTFASVSNSYAVAFGSSPNDIAVPVYSQTSPTAYNLQYPVGKRWINTVSNLEYVLTSISSSQGTLSANWALNSQGGPGSFTTLTSTGNTFLATGSGAISTIGNSSSGNTSIISGSSLIINPASPTASVFIGGNALAPITIGAAAQTGAINIGNSSAAVALTLGSTNGASTTTINGGTGGIVFAPTNGNISSSIATNSVSGISITLNAIMGQLTFTGETTAAGSFLTLTHSCSFATASSAIFATVANGGSNDAEMTLYRINPSSGQIVYVLYNSGAADLNGNVYITYWLVNA